MRLTFLGTGSAIPSPNRLQTSLLVESGDHTLLVDCGGGACHRLAGADTDHNTVDALLLTHTHLDHVADLSTLVKARWLDGTPDLDVYGPPGTGDVVGKLLAIDDLGERAEVSVTELDPGAAAVEIGPHRIEYTETTHSARCFAYRVDDRLTISGDTAPDESVFALADGSDVLVHECSFPDGVDSAGHTTPTELGDRLAGISVGAVYLTHLFPETESRIDEPESTVGARVAGPVVVPDELDSVGIESSTAGDSGR